MLTLLFLTATLAADPPRSERSLDGPWQFRRDSSPADAWKNVAVPSTFQSHEGTDWHGVGWYRRSVSAVLLPAGKRLLVHFDAAATKAEVFWNGTKVGEHLGGWTPFRCDVTDLVRAAQPGAAHELSVKLDEKLGHNTQGFLPIIQPHFGGLWQSVKLLTVPDSYLDDLTLSALPTDKPGQFRVTAPLVGTPFTEALVSAGHAPGQETSATRWNDDGRAVTSIEVTHDLPAPVFWSPQQPSVVTLTVSLKPRGAKEPTDAVTVRTGQRVVEARKDQLFFNGRPLVVRGVLNWGYYPPDLAPRPSDDVWRADLKLLKAWGFNTVKCCLWVPPRRLLDIADEEGVFVWQEYPTWHPDLTPKHLPDLTREFAEFFAHDRNHPSVILRSLTCETGPSADLAVLRALTDRCKQMVPGALVEDDSSWIEWNRVTDFYDDHPYGNNHTWLKTLDRLKAYKKLGVKPLLLGEAIAADTWVPADAVKVGTERPHWLPGFFDANPKWLAKLPASSDRALDRQLQADSLSYALLMRKYQIEAYRREVPNGGYVVSVMRDFPLAAMGLIDYAGQPKWPAERWSWHGDTMLLLRTPNDRRTFSAGERLKGELTVAHAGPAPLRGGKLLAELSAGRPFATAEGAPDQPLPLDVTLPDADRPRPLLLNARFNDTTNTWPLWLVPKPRPRPDGVTVVRRLDPATLDKLEAGAKVLLLPDGGKGSPPLRAHWFLRGGPVAFDHPALVNVPRPLLIETQHFDLASDVIPDINYLSEIDPILLLWDNHDIKEVKTHALAYAVNVGRGRLLVSALKHDGDTNAVGRWLLEEFAHYLANGPAPARTLSETSVQQLRARLTEKTLDFSQRPWKFKPDGKDEGLTLRWHQPATKLDKTWKDIRIDRHWEGQGHPDLDGWAWYRLDVDVPADWKGDDAYLTFSGVDDYYEAFVNGERVGSGGDLAKKLTAFELKAAHQVTAVLKPGEKNLIAVRVHDWYGAGGIFRPVTLTTNPTPPGAGLVR